MAQGLGKLKSKGAGLKKDKNRNKKSQMKKGSRYIAPKKAKRVQEEKLKKKALHFDQDAMTLAVYEGLDKAIKTNIEDEICVKVKSIESKSFNVVRNPSTSDSKSKNDATASTSSSVKKK